MIKLFQAQKPSQWRPGYVKFLPAYARHPQGLTDQEVAAEMGLKDNHVRRARLSLTVAGYLQDTGSVRPRPGRKAAGIYQITTQGLNFLQGASA